MNNGQEQVKFIRSILLYEKSLVQLIVIKSEKIDYVKSYPSLNLAKSLVEFGRKVLLINGDMGKWMLTEIKYREGYGLLDYLKQRSYKEIPF